MEEGLSLKCREKKGDSSFVFQVKAMQQFYNGLPNQDLTVTQEEMEMGREATEHVYKVFGHIYGYSGREFFPWTLKITPNERSETLYNFNLYDLYVIVYIFYICLCGMCEWMREIVRSVFIKKEY